MIRDKLYGFNYDVSVSGVNKLVLWHEDFSGGNYTEIPDDQTTDFFNWLLVHLDTSSYDLDFNYFFNKYSDAGVFNYSQNIMMYVNGGSVLTTISLGSLVSSIQSAIDDSSKGDYYYDLQSFVTYNQIYVPSSFNKDAINIFQTSDFKPIYTVEVKCEPIATTYVFNLGKVYSGGMVVDDHTGIQIGNGDPSLYLQFTNTAGLPRLDAYDIFKFDFSGFPSIPNISSVFSKDFYCIGDVYFRHFIDAVLYMKRTSVINIPDLTAIYTESYIPSLPSDIDTIITSKDSQIQSLTSLVDSLKSDVLSLSTNSANIDLIQSKYDFIKSQYDTLMNDHFTVMGENITLKSSNSFLLDAEKLKVARLETELSALESTFNNYKLLYPYDLSSLTVPPSLTSLNGVGCEYKDGTFVSVIDRLGTYTVIRSYVVVVSDNNYTVVYDLMDDTDRRISVPESLVVSVAQTVTAP